MSEIKVGDWAWVQVMVDAIGEDDEWETHTSLFLKDDVIPDHPALPAVARWLAEHCDDGASALWQVIDVYSGSRSADVYTERTVSALLAALTDGEGK